MRYFQGYPGLLKNNEQTLPRQVSYNITVLQNCHRISIALVSWLLPAGEMFTDYSIPYSSIHVVSNTIGIDFYAGAHVQLSELTGVLQGSLLKKESSKYMCTINRKSNLKIFKLKNFCGGPMKIYIHEHLTHEYFYTQNIQIYGSLVLLTSL